MLQAVHGVACAMPVSMGMQTAAVAGAAVVE